MGAGKLRYGAVALALSAVSLAGPALAQQQATVDSSGWTGACSGTARAGVDCTLSLRATITGGDQLVAAITIRVPADTRSPVILIQVPLGIYVPSGVSLAVDGGAATPGFIQTCDANGCYAGMALAPELLTAMKGGTQLQLGLEDLSRAGITVSVPLAGFAAAYAAIE